MICENNPANNTVTPFAFVSQKLGEEKSVLSIVLILGLFFLWFWYVCCMVSGFCILVLCYLAFVCRGVWFCVSGLSFVLEWRYERLDGKNMSKRESSPSTKIALTTKGKTHQTPNPHCKGTLL